MNARVLLHAALLFLCVMPTPALAAVPRPTCQLSASSGAVQVGQTINLSWRSQNATAGNITSIGSVAPNGIQGVIPTPPQTTYVGTFTGPGGSGVCSITVSVNAGDGSGGYSSGGVPKTGENPIVPAPTFTPASGIVPCDGINCQACDISKLAQRIINWLIGFSIPLAAAMFAYAGVMLFTSQGNPNARKLALEVFKNVGIGFVIVLCAWLGIQTILKAVLKPTYYKNWNKIECTNGGRVGVDTKVTINDLINSLPLLNKNAIQVQNISPGNIVSRDGLTYDDATGCAAGGTWNTAIGGCVNAEGDVVAPVGFSGGLQQYREPTDYSTCYSGDYLQDGKCLDAFGEKYDPYTQNNSRVGPEGSCQAGYRYAEDSEYAWCQGPGGADDIRDFQTPGKGGGPVLTCDPSNSKCGDIASAIDGYRGTFTGNGPAATEAGNKACAWAVNNVLQNAGVAPIDGLSVQSMKDELDAGRGTSVSAADAQRGDIIVWKEGRVSHVGFCDNDGCTKTISNSSGDAKFISTQRTFGGVEGKIYRVNKI